MDEQQARVHAEALDAALRDSVGAKSDVDELRREIREVETRLEAKIETSAANLKVDILRWMGVTQIALAGIILAAIRFIR